MGSLNTSWDSSNQKRKKWLENYTRLQDDYAALRHLIHTTLFSPGTYKRLLLPRLTLLLVAIRDWVLIQSQCYWESFCLHLGILKVWIKIWSSIWKKSEKVKFHLDSIPTVVERTIHRSDETHISCNLTKMPHISGNRNYVFT